MFHVSLPLIGSLHAARKEGGEGEEKRDLNIEPLQTQRVAARLSSAVAAAAGGKGC